MRRLALQGSARRLLTRLHRWSGLAIMGLLAIAGVTGGVLAFREDIDRRVALAWPAAWRRVAGRRQTCTVRRGEGAFKATFDLHRSLGVCLLPIWIVLAFTSVYLSFPNLVRSATAVFSPITAPSIGPSRWTGGPLITPDEAVAAALAAVPSATAFGFTRDFTNGRYSVRLVLPDDVNPAGNSQAYVDFATGHVLAITRPSEASRGLRFLYWQFPLHSGGAFGAPGRIGIALSGLALVVMGAAGLYLWLRGWTLRRATRQPRVTMKETA